MIVCPLDEIERFHKRDLTEDVATANRAYNDYVARQQAKREADTKAQQEERDEVRAKLGKLKFD